MLRSTLSALPQAALFAGALLIATSFGGLGSFSAAAQAQDAAALGPIISPLPGGGNNGGIPKLPPGLDKLPAGSPWREITSTDPRAMCGRGTPFGFFLHEGDPKKLVINFAGGGACFDAQSCGKDNPTFFPDLNIIRLLVGTDQSFGVFTETHADNPFNGWTHLVIPNCTGDLNLGDNDETYKNADGTSFVLNHRGAPNSEAALQWIHARYEQNADSPEKVVVVGSSAGAYASIVFTPRVQALFPEATVRQLGDSGAGITAAGGSFPAQWNVGATLPQWVPGLNAQTDDLAKLNVAGIYRALANYYPKIEFAQFNYNQDEIQSFFFLPFDTKAIIWQPLMYGSVLPLQALPNFHTYIASGTTHAILVLPQMYSLDTYGVPFTQWLANYMNGGTPTNVVSFPQFDPSDPQPQPQPTPPPAAH